MTALLDQVRTAARTVLAKWPEDKNDAHKSNRAFAGYDLGFLPLRDLYKRADVLKILDKLFWGLRASYSTSGDHSGGWNWKAVILERVAKAGSLSLEVVEHLVIKPTIADVIETMWLCSPPSERGEFLRRIGK